MPIYEYICKDCNKSFEKLRFNTKEKVACPSCGGKHNALQLSVVATPTKLGAMPSYREAGESTLARGTGSCGNCGCN